MNSCFVFTCLISFSLYFNFCVDLSHLFVSYSEFKIHYFMLFVSTNNFKCLSSISFKNNNNGDTVTSPFSFKSFLGKFLI